MAKIAYIGNFEPEYSTENDVRKAIEALGHTCIPLQENKTPLDAVRTVAMDSDILLHTGTWGDAFDLADYLTLIHDLAQAKIPSATLHLDTFWVTSRGGRKWWLEPMFHTSVLFTADGDWQKQWELMGKQHVWLLPAVRHDGAHFGKPRPEYNHDVSFVGSNGEGYHEDVWSYRKELLDNLRQICSKNGWSFRNPGGDEPKIDRSDDMNDFYASGKVTVGDSLCIKKEEALYWSDRVPEATGRGAYLIMPRIKKLQTLYPDMAFYDWGDWENLEYVIKLSMENDTAEVTKQMQNETAQFHTYKNRVKTILNYFDIGVKDDNK